MEKATRHGSCAWCGKKHTEIIHNKMYCSEKCHELAKKQKIKIIIKNYEVQQQKQIL